MFLLRYRRIFSIGNHVDGHVDAAAFGRQPKLSTHCHRHPLCGANGRAPAAPDDDIVTYSVHMTVTSSARLPASPSTQHNSSSGGWRRRRGGGGDDCDTSCTPACMHGPDTGRRPLHRNAAVMTKKADDRKQQQQQQPHWRQSRPNWRLARFCRI